MRLTRPLLRILYSPHILPPTIAHPNISECDRRILSSFRVACIPRSTVMRNVSTSPHLGGSKDYKDRKRELQRVTDSKTGSEKVRMAAQSVPISLFDPEGSMTVTTQVEAERLAQRRGLRLMRHPDKEVENKFRRPAYKLVTSKEYFETSGQDKKKSSGSYIKGETIVEFSHRISDHDLQVKIKGTMLRNLKKSKQVRLSLIGTETTQKRLNELLSIVQDGVAEAGAKVVQIQKKGHDIKCLINPPRPEKKKDSSATEGATSDSET